MSETHLRRHASHLEVLQIATHYDTNQSMHEIPFIFPHSLHSASIARRPGYCIQLHIHEHACSIHNGPYSVMHITTYHTCVLNLCICICLCSSPGQFLAFQWCMFKSGRVWHQKSHDLASQWTIQCIVTTCTYHMCVHTTCAYTCSDFCMI